MKNVLLIGIDGVYNYGCEAIIRGTVAILKSVDPAITVSYASYNYEDDLRRLSGCEVNILCRPKRKRWTFHNIIRKLLSFIHVAYVVPYDSTQWIKGFDTVFSIGGDIYTLSPDLVYYPALPLFLEKCQSLGLTYVLWGASVGKFEKNAEALVFYKKHLAQIDRIVAREAHTVDYLRSLGIQKNVCLAPDPAFFVKAPALFSERESKLTIGINLSPLSALYEYGDLETAIRRQSEALTRLVDEWGCRILLLPHVISPSPLDNDLLYMQTLYKNLPSESYQNTICLVDTDPQFVGLKNYLLQCNYVIAARMHCAINAVTLSIPTLFLSYSEKAKGMAEFVYGTNEAVISLPEFENTSLLISKLEENSFRSQLEEIRRFNYQKIFS